MTLAAASIVVIYAAVGASWTTVLLYQWVTKGACWRDWMGVHLMAISLVDAAIFSLLLAAYLHPPLALQSWYQWGYVTSVAGIPIVNAWRAVILWILYRRRVAPTPSTEGVGDA
jgi:hypothetical protein